MQRSQPVSRTPRGTQSRPAHGPASPSIAGEPPVEEVCSPLAHSTAVRGWRAARSVPAISMFCGLLERGTVSWGLPQQVIGRRQSMPSARLSPYSWTRSTRVTPHRLACAARPGIRDDVFHESGRRGGIEGAGTSDLSSYITGQTSRGRRFQPQWTHLAADNTSSLLEDESGCAAIQR